MAVGNNKKKRDTVLDAISFIAVGLTFIVLPLWCYFDNECRNPSDGRPPPEFIILLVNFIPCAFGINWLLYRYHAYLPRPTLRFKIWYMLFCLITGLIIPFFFVG